MVILTRCLEEVSACHDFFESKVLSIFGISLTKPALAVSYRWQLSKASTPECPVALLKGVCGATAHWWSISMAPYLECTDWRVVLSEESDNAERRKEENQWSVHSLLHSLTSSGALVCPGNCACFPSEVTSDLARDVTVVCIILWSRLSIAKSKDFLVSTVYSQTVISSSVPHWNLFFEYRTT